MSTETLTKPAQQPFAHDIEQQGLAQNTHDGMKIAGDYMNADRAISYAVTGMKPVFRRSLYYGLLHNNNIHSMKTAAFASAVAGALHPHGDESIAKALSGISANYQRVRLFELLSGGAEHRGQAATAPRYTDIKVSDLGIKLIEDLKYGEVVPFEEDYTMKGREPVYFPSAFPVMLMNGAPKGSMGFGWATTIPQHNPLEVMDATIALAKKKSLSLDEILEIMPGPDFYNAGKGGILISDQAGIREYYETGKGYFYIRGDVELDEKKKIIHVTSLPAEISPFDFVSDLKKKVIDKKIQGITSVDNYVTGSQLDIEIEVKKSSNIHSVLSDVYALTQLEFKYSPNIVALRTADGGIQWWNIKDLLQEFLDMRMQVIAKRSELQITDIQERTHILKGMLAISIDIDKAIGIIRASDDPETAKKGLADAFGVDDTQAEYILSRRLSSLTKTNQIKLKSDIDELESQLSHLQSNIEDESYRKKTMIAELKETRKLFADDERYQRHTQIEFDTPLSKASKKSSTRSKSKSNATWYLNHEGVLSTSAGTGVQMGKTQNAFAMFNDGKMKLTNVSGMSPRKPHTVRPTLDGLVASFPVGTKDEVIVFSRNGKALRMSMDKVNAQGEAGSGVAGMKLGDSADVVVGALPYSENAPLVSITGIDGKSKIISASDIPLKGKGGQGVNVFPGGGVASAEPVESGEPVKLNITAK